jgi:DNA integrity scanning protein DisA with diadenylate cyclase activity
MKLRKGEKPIDYLDRYRAFKAVDYIGYQISHIFIGVIFITIALFIVMFSIGLFLNLVKHTDQVYNFFTQQIVIQWLVVGFIIVVVKFVIMWFAETLFTRNVMWLRFRNLFSYFDVFAMVYFSFTGIVGALVRRLLVPLVIRIFQFARLDRASSVSEHWNDSRKFS